MEHPSVWICLVLHEMHVLHRWQEYPRGDTVLSSLIPSGGVTAIIIILNSSFIEIKVTQTHINAPCENV